ncbi:MAG: DUF72 domain-containing protein [Lentisphaerae bacterium]|nr:DUF72 domain-containing protein [Lentisphaerota bacterium]MBT4814396.1 DUF72 domain-containing protein [Lentisphaerota bacterium]MBT5608512.1 DUF72 domain-containing protein [Lentisphaerota bacterium]MBT7058520.1 DUF72 domain-containing protein [Lentisphaerota bacterium]MBT7843229.1 DUF72 domain-containing protein [Lentisphaerota bacterium]
MPHIGDLPARLRTVTTDISVLRLHGSDRADIEKRTGKVWSRVVDPQPGGLTAASRIIRANASRKVLTYVNVNNHFEGSAPLTIARLAAELGRQAEGQPARLPPAFDCLDQASATEGQLSDPG